MITVTRRDGSTFALNPDLIERVEAAPDTVVTLVSGTQYVVVESVEQVVAEVCQFRAAVLQASAASQTSASFPVRLRLVHTLER